MCGAKAPSYAGDMLASQITCCSMLFGQQSLSKNKKKKKTKLCAVESVLTQDVGPDQEKGLY